MSAAGGVRVTYFLEVISSWCWWTEPAWEEVKARFAGRVEFDWKIALMDASGLPVSQGQLEWFYRRSGTLTRSPYQLNSGWYEAELKEYLAPNLVAEAAKDFGITDDRARLAIARAGLREGRKVGRWETAAEVAGAATGIDPTALLERAKSSAVESRCRATTDEFHALQVSQRPAFLLESGIGDRAVFSGVWGADPLVFALEALLQDAAGYASFAAHFGGPPPT